MPAPPASIRFCPLLERSGPSRQLAHAPQPWDLRRCAETGFVFLANPPAQDLFRDQFAWEVTHDCETEARRLREPWLHFVSTAAKRFRERYLHRNKMAALVADVVTAVGRPNVRLVDIGCANGKLLRQLTARLPRRISAGIEPIGIEISTALAAEADRALRAGGGRCIHATGIDGLAELPAGSVDVIVLSCILEHEILPLPLLRSCRERLADDGRIVVKVPNHDCLARRLRGGRWCGYRWPDHVNYFTPSTLAAMARRAGLRVVRMNLTDRLPSSDSLYAVLGPDRGA